MPERSLRIGAVAVLLRTSKEVVRGIPREELPYWPSPIGRHRQYLREDVVAYARDHQGRAIT
jgi:hypothetical protein